MYRFIVAFADAHQVRGEVVRFWMTMLEVSLELTALSTQSICEFVQGSQQLQDFSELLFRNFFSVGEVAQLHVFAAELNENFVELNIVFDVLDALLAGHLVKRWLSDIDISLPNELRHLTVKEREQQGADV